MFAIMASVTLMLVVVWERSPFLAAALAGPIVAVGLYQRSAQRALSAMRLALTDPLTGLGNQRHFDEALERHLATATAEASSLGLCVVDLDDLKGINDRNGHPVADRVLAQVAAHLRRSGEAFRLGGDEFALLLPGMDEREAMQIATRVVQRIAAGRYEHGCEVSVSAGVVTFPRHGNQAAELLRVADSALYCAKEQGKNRACSYTEELVELVRRSRFAGGEGDALLRAAAGVARTVDARAAYAPSHCEAVSVLAKRLAARLGLDAEEAELVGLAGRLHDLGKLSVPEEILRKPGVLTEPERRIVERHAQVGFRMLDCLGGRSISRWVLHQHERWDGNGYPDRLSGDRIPLAARILFVADAFDAMTAERPYRREPLTEEEALAELERCAGSQFDPDVVAALAEELEQALGDDLPAELWGPDRPLVASVGSR
jgi:diguanylate cyclase (GGDEF)-like protein